MAFAYDIALNDPWDYADAETEAALLARLGDALGMWGNHVSGLGTLEIAFNIVDTPAGTASAVVNGGYVVGRTADGARLVELASSWLFNTGEHVPGLASDVTVDLDPDYLALLFLGAPGEEVPGWRIDATSVFLHEIGHALGITGYRGQDGGIGAYESRFDSFVEFGPDGHAYFTGPEAEAVFGGKVPLTSTHAPENYYHLADDWADAHAGDLMNGLSLNFGTTYRISALDLAILADIGLAVTYDVLESVAVADGFDAYAPNWDADGYEANWEADAAQDWAFA